MSVIERCLECGGPVGPLDLEAENENLREALATVARTEQATAGQLAGAVEALRESAETLHRVSSWWEHAERSFEDCPAESCVKARAAIGGQ